MLYETKERERGEKRRKKIRGSLRVTTVGIFPPKTLRTSIFTGPTAL